MRLPFSYLANAIALTVALIGSPLTVAAQDAAGTTEANAIVVYNAQHASLTQAWADGFTRETGIKVTLRKGGDTELGNQIVQEGAASPADVFLTENSPAMALVDTAGLFAPLAGRHPGPGARGVPPADGNWTGIAARSTVFAYDKRKLDADQLPKSMLDLADPSWKGRWAASPSGADFQAIVGALLELKGEAATADWLQGDEGRTSSAYRGNSTAMKAVNAGEVDGARDLPLLLVRRSGEDRREQRQRGPALLQQPGSGRIRQRLRRRRARVEQAPGGRPQLRAAG